MYMYMHHTYMYIYMYMYICLPCGFTGFIGERGINKGKNMLLIGYHSIPWKCLNCAWI